MDKRMVLSAYRKGFITMQECAQILGIDSMQIMGMINDPQGSENIRGLHKQRTVNR
jgi:hypothetical protein